MNHFLECTFNHFLSSRVEMGHWIWHDGSWSRYMLLILWWILDWFEKLFERRNVGLILGIKLRWMGVLFYEILGSSDLRDQDVTNVLKFRNFLKTRFQQKLDFFHYFNSKILRNWDIFKLENIKPIKPKGCSQEFFKGGFRNFLYVKNWGGIFSLKTLEN